MPTQDLAPDEKTNKILYWAESEESLHDFCNCPQLTSQDAQKIIRSFRPFLKTGSFPKNDVKFRHEGDKICAIKSTSQLRLLGFFDNLTTFIIVHCIKKKQDKLPKKDKDLAITRRKAYYKEKKDH